MEKFYTDEKKEPSNHFLNLAVTGKTEKNLNMTFDKNCTKTENESIFNSPPSLYSCGFPPAVLNS